MNELMLLRQLFGESGWLQPVFLLGLFAALLFRRDCITSPGKFKLAYVLFALSLILPAVVGPVLGSAGYQSMARMFAGRAYTVQSDVGFTLSVISTAGGPTLFGLSIIFALASMMPRKPPPPPAPPAKHPLD